MRETLAKRNSARQECRGLIGLRGKKSGLSAAICAFLGDGVAVDHVLAPWSGNLLPNRDRDAPISAK